MKCFLIGAVVDTKKSTTNEIEKSLQKRLDDWLGKDKTQIKVNVLNSETIKFTLYRKYGDWYEDPQRFQPQRSVFSWDEIILFGDDYQTGTYADLETLTGRYVISYHEDDFFQDYKKKAREKHCTRIKNLEQQSFLDRIEFTVELLQQKKRQHP